MITIELKAKLRVRKFTASPLIMGTFSLHTAHQDFHKNGFGRELFRLMVVRIKMGKLPKKGEIQETALYFTLEKCPSRTFFC